MTNEESLRTLLAKVSQKHGEDGFFAKQLKAQLDSLEYFKKVKPPLGTETFHIGARGEDRPDGTDLDARRGLTE